MMEISTDIEGSQPDYVSVDEMVEVEYIEVTEEENLTSLDTIAASNYIDTSGEADNCSLFSPEPGDDVSSQDEEKEDEPEEASNNRVPSKRRHSSWRKRFRTESAKLEYNRQKASIQRVRRQDLVEGFSKLRAAIGATEQEYKTSNKFINHVIDTIPLAERQLASQKCRISCLEQENSVLEEKIRILELEKASSTRNRSYNNTHEEEERPKASFCPQSS